MGGIWRMKRLVVVCVGLFVVLCSGGLCGMDFPCTIDGQSVQCESGGFGMSTEGVVPRFTFFYNQTTNSSYEYDGAQVVAVYHLSFDQLQQSKNGTGLGAPVEFASLSWSTPVPTLADLSNGNCSNVVLMFNMTNNNSTEWEMLNILGQIPLTASNSKIQLYFSLSGYSWDIEADGLDLFIRYSSDGTTNNGTLVSDDRVTLLDSSFDISLLAADFRQENGTIQFEGVNASIISPAAMIQYSPRFSNMLVHSMEFSIQPPTSPPDQNNTSESESRGYWPYVSIVVGIVLVVVCVLGVSIFV